MADFLLQETGDKILQETGDGILLEGNWLLDQSQIAANNVMTLRYSATLNTEIGQRFVPSHTAEICSVTFYLRKAGSPTGTIWAKIYSDSSGLPGTLLASSIAKNSADIPGTDTEEGFIFSGANKIILTKGKTYHVVMAGDYAVSDTDAIVVNTNTADAYANGITVRINTGAWETDVGDCFFKTYYDADTCYWNIQEENWDSVADWTDASSANCFATISPVGQLYLDLKTAAGDSEASRYRSWIRPSGDIYMEMRFKGDVWDVKSNFDGGISFVAQFNNYVLHCKWGNGLGSPASDGIWIYDGASWVKVYTHTFDTNWHTIRWCVHNGQTDCDVWLDGVLVASDAVCTEAVYSDWRIIRGYGTASGNGEYHIDYWNMGTKGFPTESKRENFVTDLSSGADTSGLVYTSMSFTTTVKHTLTKAFLYLKRVGVDVTGVLTVNIYAGDANHKPTGASLGSHSILVSDITTAYLQYEFIFSEITLAENSIYCIVISNSSATSDIAVGYQATSAHAPKGYYTYSSNGGSSWISYAGCCSYEVWGFNTGYSGTPIFYPDAGIGHDTVDGGSYRQLGGGETFAALRAGTSNCASTPLAVNGDSPCIYSHTDTNKFDYMYRGYLLFDTSFLPDNCRIKTAILSMYVTAKNDNFNQAVCLVAATPVADNDLGVNDYDIAKFGTTEYATRVDITDIATSAYLDMPLNAAGIAAIAKTGITRFGLRLSCDLDNSAPTWVSATWGSISINFADNLTLRPKLTITYESDSASIKGRIEKTQTVYL